MDAVISLEIILVVENDTTPHCEISTVHLESDRPEISRSDVIGKYKQEAQELMEYVILTCMCQILFGYLANIMQHHQLSLDHRA